MVDYELLQESPLKYIKVLTSNKRLKKIHAKRKGGSKTTFRFIQLTQNFNAIVKGTDVVGYAGDFLCLDSDLKVYIVPKKQFKKLYQVTAYKTDEYSQKNSKKISF